MENMKTVQFTSEEIECLKKNINYMITDIEQEVDDGNDKTDFVSLLLEKENLTNIIEKLND